MKLALLVLTAIAVAMMNGVATVRADQVTADQGQLARDLATGAEYQHETAVDASLRIPPNQRTPVLLSAMMGELERLRSDLERRRLGVMAGKPVTPTPDEGAYLFKVITVVSQSEDPAVIHALLPFIGTGNRVMTALAAFGDPSVKDVTTIAMDPTSHDAVPALVTLRRMLEQPVRQPLSAASRQLIINAAERRMTAPQNHLVLGAAIDVAVATLDPLLIRKVRELAARENAVRALGISDAKLVGVVQKRASDALARLGPR